MVFLLLVSTTSWKVEKHYCLGHVMDISFFTPAEDCGMETGTSADDNSIFQSEDSCCSDVTILMQGQDDLSISYNDFSIAHPLFFVVFTYSYFNIAAPEEVQPIKHHHYPPPIIVKDIQLLDETFLI